MFTFHKPKVFRSGSGCCICRAKSSSSRFTDSKKYEPVFLRCFDLDEERTGEICNACVLLVKRFIKLPPGSTRNWNHVVDARSGPGIKSLKRSVKPKDESEAESEDSKVLSPEKFKKKHVFKRARKTNKPVKRNENSAGLGQETSDFLDMSFWKREQICCGTIFRGRHGEVVIDARFFTPCNSCQKQQDTTAKKVPDVNDVIRQVKATVTATHVSDFDEGFFDRPAPSPAGSCSPIPSCSSTSADDLEVDTSYNTRRLTRGVGGE